MEGPDPLELRFAVTAKRIFWTQFRDAAPTVAREAELCDTDREDRDHPVTVESSLEPYIILAKLRLDIELSQQRIAPLNVIW